MAWLWECWEEFDRYVRPIAVQEGRFRHIQRATELESLGDLLDAVRDLRAANRALTSLGFDDTMKMEPKDEATMHKAHSEVMNAVYAGEALLLHHRRLTITNASYGFLHAHDILDHWERYAANTRILREIQKFTVDVDRLLEGYDRLVRDDERLLVDDLELPEDLKRDFEAARNLFSIGLDDIGLFIAGRGLEKILRRIAKDRKIGTHKSWYFGTPSPSIAFYPRESS